MPQRTLRRPWILLFLLGLGIHLGTRPSNAELGAPEAPQGGEVKPLLTRTPESLLSGLKDSTRRQSEDRYAVMITEDADRAASLQLEDLYPNPIVQAYVNQLGQSMTLPQSEPEILLSFRVAEDPLPYSDALATGTIILSTGLISLLENESQLAFMLMHEAGHLYLQHHMAQVIEEEKTENRGNAIKFVGTAAGLLGGLGSLGTGIKEMGTLERLMGSAAGFWVGSKVSEQYEKFRSRRFSRAAKIEADQFAIDVMLANGFDPREVPQAMARLSDALGRSGKIADLIFGDSQALALRSTKINDALAHTYHSQIDQILEAEGFQMSSPRFSLLMSDLKRDNGLLALQRDLFVIARTNLTDAAATRTDDPLTMYGLGMLYRAVGRTDEDRAKASGYLKKAMEFDEVRRRFPEAYLQYAVELLSREDPQYYPEIQIALKKYVVLYQRKMGGSLPREMRFVYDYLDLTGDRAWRAYEVNNVNPELPYQLLGDPKLDEAPAVPKSTSTAPR